MARRSSDGGVALVVVAAALVPLTAVVGLAVDGAAWSLRGAQLQRVADAAALAGSAVLPSVPAAREAVRATAARNGVIHGVDGVDVDAETVGPAQLRVTVTDRRPTRTFSRPFLGDGELRREAVAERVRSVPLGSPRNYLATGNLAGSSDAYRGLPGVPAVHRDDVWLAVSGPCASREQGDWLLAATAGNFTSGNPPSGDRPWRGCRTADHAGIEANPAHDPSGYLVALTVPVGWPGGPFTVQVFDAARCASSTPDLGAEHDPFTTTLRVRADDPTPDTPLDNPVLATASFPTGQRCGIAPVLPQGYVCGSDGTWQMRWCNLATIADAVPGATYFVQLSTSGTAAGARHGTNGLALRVRSGAAALIGGFTPCSTDPTDVAVPYQPDTCVSVSGVRWLSLYAAGSGAAPTFALAEVGAEHAGSSMEVALHDIGEGAEAVQVLDPLGRAVGFGWRVDADPGDAPPQGGWTGAVAPGGALDVRGIPGVSGCGEGNMQRRTGRFSSSKFNDRVVRLTVAIPPDAGETFGDRRWWRVRYATCAGRAPSDRTTWGLRVDGAPTRLVR